MASNSDFDKDDTNSWTGLKVPLYNPVDTISLIKWQPIINTSYNYQNTDSDTFAVSSWDGTIRIYKYDSMKNEVICKLCWYFDHPILSFDWVT